MVAYTKICKKKFSFHKFRFFKIFLDTDSKKLKEGGGGDCSIDPNFPRAERIIENTYSVNMSNEIIFDLFNKII